MINNEFLHKDIDMVPEKATPNILLSKSAVCMYDNGKDTTHTKHISRRIQSFRFIRDINNLGLRCSMPRYIMHLYITS